MAEPRQPRVLLSRGLRHMVAGALFLSVMAVLVKIAGRRIPSQEIVLARAVVTLVMTWIALRREGVSPWGNDKPRLVLRGLAGFGGLQCYFFAVTHLPLADATVIQYTSPVLTALLAAVLLREGLGWVETVAGLCCLGGILLVAQPSFVFDTGRSLDPLAVTVAAGGALLAALAYVVVRRLRHTDHPLVVVFWFSLVAVPATVPTLIGSAVWPRGWEWLTLLGVGVATQLGQVHLTRGLHLEPAGRAMSVTYLQVVFAHLWGALLFAELPNAFSLGGALLVVLGTLAVARRAS